MKAKHSVEYALSVGKYYCHLQFASVCGLNTVMWFKYSCSNYSDNLRSCFFSQGLLSQESCQIGKW